jgi:hypothetical protein
MTNPISRCWHGMTWMLAFLGLGVQGCSQLQVLEPQDGGLISLDAPVIMDTSQEGGVKGIESCIPNGICVVPDNPCAIGMIVCGEKGSGCVPSSRNQPNGIACGAQSVCRDGACKSCDAGAVCPLEHNPCRAGAIDCSSGMAQCIERGSAANGTACGNGNVCKDGTCTSCTAGDRCVPANPCHAGTLACVSGYSSCTDSNVPIANATTCGSGMVCNEGSCVACTPTVPCPTGDPCRVGAISCATGKPECIASADAPDGSICGAGKVCKNGGCMSCTAGMACEPAPCRTGYITCNAGTSRCNESGSVPDGRVCGAGKYCLNGNCSSCDQGSSCKLTNSCKAGIISCSTGAPQCTETGNLADGTTCGSGHECKNGSCLPSCTAGGSCNVGTPCHGGRISCDSGAPVCVDIGPDDSRGGCSGGNVCRNGACLLPDGKLCGSGAECASSSCNQFWPDTDKDGHGAADAQPQRLCGRLPPTGYAASNDDCCDSDKNAHPGQDNFFADANKCGSFDYNCNGCTGLHSSDSCASVNDWNVDDLPIIQCFTSGGDCGPAGTILLEGLDLGPESCGKLPSLITCAGGGCFGNQLANTSHVEKCR